MKTQKKGFELDALFSEDDTVWEKHVQSLGEQIQARLPGSSFVTDSLIWTFEIHWQDGPAPLEVEKLLTEIIGEKPRKDRDDVEGLDLQWERLSVELHRDHSAVARGHALLCAALSGCCERCDSGPDTFSKVYGDALRKSHPEKSSQHRSLAGLEALGVRAEKLEMLAELLGALHEKSTDGKALHHKRGHLAGLVALAEAIHTSEA